MYILFEYGNGGNPYITTKETGLFNMIKKYELETVGKDHYRIIGRNRKPQTMTTYNHIKEVLRSFIIEWSLLFSEYSFFQSELIEWACFFETYGKKYGLTKELKENGIL